MSRYNRNGFVEDLPSMIRSRMDHGCGHFVNSQNQKVCIQAIMMKTTSNNVFRFEVFLVAGGQFDAEYLIAGSSSWVLTAYIPGGIGNGARGISFMNRVLMTGNC